MKKEGKTEIIEAFKKRQKRQFLAIVPVLGVVIGMVLLDETEGPAVRLSSSPLSAVFLGVFVATVLFSIFNWTCPSCSAYLGRGINPKFCRKCGAQLQ